MKKIALHDHNIVITKGLPVYCYVCRNSKEEIISKRGSSPRFFTQNLCENAKIRFTKLSDDSHKEL